MQQKEVSFDLKYAKPDQSYKNHINAVFDAWQQIISSKKRLIERMCSLYNIPTDDILKLSLLSIALHDLGKMNVPFQQMMASLNGEKPFNKKNNFRHELSSFPFVVAAGADLRSSAPAGTVASTRTWSSYCARKQATSVGCPMISSRPVADSPSTSATSSRTSVTRL